MLRQAPSPTPHCGVDCGGGQATCSISGLAPSAQPSPLPQPRRARHAAPMREVRVAQTTLKGPHQRLSRQCKVHSHRLTMATTSSSAFDEKHNKGSRTLHHTTSVDDDAGRANPPTLTEDGQESFTFSDDEEKRLVRKIDARLLPSVWLMYLMSYLDRSNIGNAYTVSDHVARRVAPVPLQQCAADKMISPSPRSGRNGRGFENDQQSVLDCPSCLFHYRECGGSGHVERIGPR